MSTHDYDGVFDARGVDPEPPPERPETQGFQKPLDDGKRKQVNMPLVSYVGIGAVCSCGKPIKASRPKVLEDRIDKHLNDKHNGRGIRL